MIIAYVEGTCNSALTLRVKGSSQNEDTIKIKSIKRIYTLTPIENYKRLERCTRITGTDHEWAEDFY